MPALAHPRRLLSIPWFNWSAPTVLGGAAAVAGLAALTLGLVLTWPSDDASLATPTDPARRAEVATIAGSGPSRVGGGGLANGTALSARFNEPSGLARSADGTVYLADFGNNVIRRIGPAGDVSVLAGSGSPGLRDGIGAAAEFNGPTAVALDATTGNLYVADTGNHRVRRIDSAGAVSTVAGSGPPGLGQGAFADGPVGSARLNLPKGIAVDAGGSVYVADTDNLRIRVIRPNGTVETFAGTGQLGTQDGPRLQATFGHIVGIAFDETGSLWVADQSNRLIRRITPEGVVQTVVLKISIGFAASVIPLADGTFAVSDTSAHVVRLFQSDGTQAQVFGSGRQGYADGPAATAEFSNPIGIVAAGNDLLVADSSNHRIRRLTK